MGRKDEKNVGADHDESGKLYNELWVALPFFLLSLLFFFGSFQYKRGANYVPMLVGFITAILTGLRLFHIFFPGSRIGEFKETGLAGEFDQIKEEIEEETLKGHYEEPKAKEITFSDERKAFIALIGSFLIFLLFGYIVGCFLVVIGTSYYYGYRAKLPLALVALALFLVVYVILYRMLEAPADFGILLGPVLEYLNMI